MSGWTRKLILAAIVLVNAAAGWLILTNASDYRINLDSVLAIWSDFVRDADKIGLTVTRLSTAKEIEIGNEMMAYYPIEQGTPLAKYVDEVGQQVAKNARRKDMPYKFHVLDTSEINAYALPGGHVFITKPMLGLMKTEAELASILGHEIAHIDLRHCIERLQYEIRARQVLGGLAVIVRLAHDLVGVAYSKQQESEADRSGMLLMAEAGYSPIESLEIFVRLQAELGGLAPGAEKTAGPEGEVVVAINKLLKDYFRTHPLWTERVTELQTLLEQNAGTWSKTDFCVGATNFRDRIPCFVESRAGETEKISPESPTFQLKLAILADGAGQRLEAEKRFRLALQGDKRLADEYLKRGKDRLARSDRDGAVLEFGLALKLLLLQVANVTLLPENESLDNRRSLVREALGRHTVLITELGRSDYALIPAAAVDYPHFDAAALCAMSLNKLKTAWNADSKLKDAITELKSRKLGINDCRLELDLPRLAELELEEWSDRDVCRRALDTELIHWSAWNLAVLQAKKRGFSVDRCRSEFDQPPLSLAKLEGLSKVGICWLSLDDDRTGWGRFSSAVTEARRRDYGLDDCREALVLPKSSELSNDKVCRGAIGPAPRIWSNRELMVTEAKRRTFTIAECRAILGLVSLQPTNLEDELDNTVCLNALDLARTDWSNYESAVLEALGRGFSINRCRSLIGLPRLAIGGDGLDDYSRYMQLADSHRGAGNYGDAIKEYSRAIAIDPEHGKAYVGRGYAFQRLHKDYEAIADISIAIEFDPKDVGARTARCESYIEVNELEKAIQDCSKAIELDPVSKFAYLSRGNAYRFEGLYDKAIGDYSMVILLEPSNFRAYTARGFAHEGGQDYDSSIADFEKAIELKPDFAWAYLGLGQVSLEMGNSDKALVSFSKAIEINPSYAQAYFSRARLSFVLGDLEKSLPDFQRATELEPKSAYKALWLEIVNRRVNRPSQLSKSQSTIDMTVWPAPLIRLYLGDATLNDVIEKAKDPDEKKSREQLCEAHFYGGEWELQRGAKDDAIRLLRLASQKCPANFMEFGSARAELKALGIAP